LLRFSSVPLFGLSKVTTKVLFPDADFAVYGAYMDWLKANSQKKKLGGWLNNYK
jgi:hypothetical protein